MALLGCPGGRVGQDSSGQIAAESKMVESDDTVATSQLATKPEVVEEVYEDGPRTTVGDEMRAAEEAFPVGKWGRVMTGLVSANPNSDDYKIGYQEIEFHKDMTFSWTGWQIGSYFEIFGEYRHPDESTIYLRCLRTGRDEDGVGKNLVWVDETWGKLTQEGEYKLLQTSSGGNFGFLWQVVFDRKLGRYLDSQGNVLGPAR